MIGIPVKLFELVKLADIEHACGVAQIARQAATNLGVSPDLAYIAGLLHDVGKVLIPRQIVDFPGPLTPDWRAEVELHPVHGAALVEEHWPYVSADVLHAVKHHHERLDGRGYPDGLCSLPRLTMLIAASDVFDALRRDRQYRPAFDLSTAAKLLRQEELDSIVIEQVLQAAVQAQASRQDWPTAVSYS